MDALYKCAHMLSFLFLSLSLSLSPSPSFWLCSTQRLIGGSLAVDQHLLLVFVQTVKLTHVLCQQPVLTQLHPAYMYTDMCMQFSTIR